MAEEVLEVNGDVKYGCRIQRLNAWESHKLCLSEMRGKILMPIDKLNGGVTFISNNPSLLETMELDKRDGEVAWEEMERGDEKSSVLSP